MIITVVQGWHATWLFIPLIFFVYDVRRSFYNFFILFLADKKKRAVLSDSESGGEGSKGAKRKKGSDSGSDTSAKPNKKKSKQLVDSDNDDDNSEKPDTGKKLDRSSYS